MYAYKAAVVAKKKGFPNVTIYNGGLRTWKLSNEVITKRAVPDLAASGGAETLEGSGPAINQIREVIVDHRRLMEAERKIDQNIQLLEKEIVLRLENVAENVSYIHGYHLTWH